MSTAQLLTSRKAPAGAAAPPRRRGDTERPAYEWAGRECLRTARPAPPATSTSEAAASADDVVSQVGWRSVRARVLAQRGDVEQAESLAREAVALADATDGPEIQAGAGVALAHVLQGSREPGRARPAPGRGLRAVREEGEHRARRAHAVAARARVLGSALAKASAWRFVRRRRTIAR
jgi:hypothetical protein